MFESWGDCVQGTGAEQVATLACIKPLFQNILTAALFFAGIVALFFIILSGIKFITSGGDPKQAEAAKKTMTFAIIGLVIILLSFFIISLIGYITGANCITQFGIDTCSH